MLTRTSETIDELAMSCVALKNYPATTFSGFTKRLRPRTQGVAYSKYLGFYLRGYLFRQAVTNHSIMTLRSSFNEEIFALLKLYLPEYDQQVKIGDFLYAIEQKIKLNKDIIAELEKAAKLLYDYWFVQFDFPNAEGKPYRASGGEVVWNEQLKREIPKSWTHGSLSDIAHITMGQSPEGSSYNTEGEGMIFYQGCTDFGHRFPTSRVYTNMPSRIAEQGDILLSVRAPVGTTNIAYEKCCVGRGLSALRSKTGASAYLFQVIQGVKEQLNVMSGNGTTFGALTKDMLYDLPVCKPKETIIVAFEENARAMAQVAFSLEKQTRELTALRDFLLPLLMNGQVRVCG